MNGRLIAAARKKVGITQEELGSRLGVSQGRAARIEKEGVGLDATQRIADALGIPVEELLEPTEEQGPNADRHLCWKCKWRAKNWSNNCGKAKGPGCDFYLQNDVERGCPPENCTLGRSRS